MRLSDNAEVPEQSKDSFGGGEGDKKTSDLISADTKIMDDGSVVGTIKKVSGFTKFSPDATGEAHYFPFVIKDTGSKMTWKKNGSETRINNSDFDKDGIIKLSNKTDKWEIIVDQKSVITFNFEKATLE